MKYEIIVTKQFMKEFKPLSKKYSSLKNDLVLLMESLEQNPKQGMDLGSGLRKIRLKILSKGKGSSGGARVITYETLINVNESQLSLLSIYNKSDFDTIAINLLKKNLGL